METKNFINSVSIGNAAEAKDTLNDMLSTRAFDALNARKINIAQTLFNNDVVEEEVELNLEDFSLEELKEFALSEEFEQLDELSKGTVRSYLKKSKEQEGGGLGRQGATTNNNMGGADAFDKSYEGKKRAIAKLGGSNSVSASKVPAK